MSVVLLCGGKGTRMFGSGYEAKALVDLGGRPIIWHIMKIYARYGLINFVLTLGHGGEAIRRYFTEYEAMTRDFTLQLGDTPHITYHQRLDMENWRITLADTGLETNKAGRVWRVRDYLEGETFHVTYGDGLGDVDLQALMAFHRGHGKLATITGYQPTSQYGIVHREADGAITGFEEKPRLTSWINAGFMVFNREALTYFEGDASLDLEREVFTRLAADGEMMLYEHTGFWRSMDTFKEAQQMEQLWQKGAPWKVW
jgi:glucose-1-phosphate cytidylyltransferase